MVPSLCRTPLTIHRRRKDIEVPKVCLAVAMETAGL